MATNLYVYTGTGNSLWVARQLALELKDATVGFVPNSSGVFKVEADRVGIIFLVRIWGVPSRVIQFINHLQVKNETYFFALAVNAGQPAATLLQLGKLMSTRGYSLAAGYSIVLPSNYTPWGGPGPVETQQRLFREAQEKSKAIAETIDEKMDFHDRHDSVRSYSGCDPGRLHLVRMGNQEMFATNVG